MMELTEEEFLSLMEEGTMFRCEVCKEKREKKGLPAITGLWLDINYHFIKHHTELHKDMGQYISRNLAGKWVNAESKEVKDFNKDPQLVPVTDTNKELAKKRTKD